MYSYASGIIRPRIRLSLAIASGLYKTAMYMVYQGPTHLLCREKILQVLPKILHVLGKFVRIDNWSLYVWSHHKDSLGLVDGRQRLMMLVNKNDMANRIKLNSSASSKMDKKRPRLLNTCHGPPTSKIFHLFYPSICWTFKINWFSMELFGITSTKH